jgi:hypothetical protein
VALKRKEGDTGGNKLAALITPLATDIADPKERLAAIRAEVLKSKALQQQLPEQTAQLLMAIGLVPLIADKLKGVRYKHELMFNLAISNVPGPREPRYFNGAEMLAMYPISVLFAGPALNMTLLGYNERLFAGIVCSDSSPHVQRIAVHARDAFEELEQAFGLQQGPRVRSRPKSRAAASAGGGRHLRAASRKLPGRRRSPARS